jgi:hypothetical protein
VFGKEPLSLLEKWYSSHCNVSLLRAQCSMLGLDALGTKRKLVARLLEKEARPMLPGFVLSWFKEYTAMRKGKRQPGSVEFSSPDIEAAIAYKQPLPSITEGEEGPENPSELEQMKATIASLQAQLSAQAATPVPAAAAGAITLTADTVTQFMQSAATAAATVAIEVAAANAKSNRDEEAAKATKLSPLAQLEKKAVDAVLSGTYFYVPSLAEFNKERLRKAGTSPRKRTRCGDLTFYSEVEIDYIREAEDPSEVTLFKQGWDALISLLLALPEEKFPKSKVQDLMNFKNALDLRKHPAENKVDLIDKMFQKYAGRMGEWEVLAETNSYLYGDILRDGHGPCAQELARSRGRGARASNQQNIAAQSTPSPTKKQRKQQQLQAASAGRAGSGGAGGGANERPGGPPLNPRAMRLCLQHCHPDNPPCSFAGCKYIHKCPCCQGKTHTARVCKGEGTWVQDTADKVRARIFSTGK